MCTQMFTHTPMTMIKKQIRINHEGYSMHFPRMKSQLSGHQFPVHISIWILSLATTHVDTASITACEWKYYPGFTVKRKTQERK